MSGCHCELPAPCWVPIRLDDVRERACPGDTAVVRLELINCGATSRVFEIATSDPIVVVEPQALTLGPLKHGVVMLSLVVPTTATGSYIERCVVSVRGCRHYNFRWTVRACCGWHHHRHHLCAALLRRHHSRDCAVDVAVEDHPDYVHHWYDHFYRERPCVPG
jgi:hypothetical protein